MPTYTYKYPRPAVTADMIVLAEEPEPKIEVGHLDHLVGIVVLNELCKECEVVDYHMLSKKFLADYSFISRKCITFAS